MHEQHRDDPKTSWWSKAISQSTI